MQHSGEEIHNPRTGQRMRFRQTADDTKGARLQIESVNPPTGVAGPEHVEQGKLEKSGMPSLLIVALLGPRFADEIRAVSPPWPVQRAAFAVLARIARLHAYAAE